MLVLMMAGLLSLAAGGEPLFFDTNDAGPSPTSVPAIEPWRTVPLDADYGGQWVTAADLHGDGKVEFVACDTDSEKFSRAC